VISRDPHQPQRGHDKVSRIPVKVEAAAPGVRSPKPSWIRAPAATSPRVLELKRLLREQGLHTVCEEAACPNLGECFAGGTATFMILGALCTRRCPFCDVAHGRPLPPDAEEPARLAHTARSMSLRYVVVTSVDRDDLPDGGATHFAACIAALREAVPGIRIEVLTPDFKKREARALEVLAATPPDVFNHNLETVPRLYRSVRPGAVYAGSLRLLAGVAERLPGVPTKSGLMLGLGETLDEVREVMADLRTHQVTMLTLGQYLQPGRDYLPVQRFVHPDEFAELAEHARGLGFREVASGPMVRSSYHADAQAAALLPADADVAG
jgi:lipoyl synthase